MKNKRIYKNYKKTLIEDGYIVFKDVYQLKCVLINYLNSTKNKYWKGECFVFDDRILLKGNS